MAFEDLPRRLIGPIARAASPSVRAARALPGLLLATAVACAGDTDGQVDRIQVDTDEYVAAASAHVIPRIRNGIGKAREARFLNDGAHVVVLDRFSPFLRLFDVSGDSVWAGGVEGGGPSELESPLAIAADERMVLVFQQGRISRWMLTDDSLAFASSSSVPPEYFPIGLEIGCSGELLLLARNDRQFKVPPDSFGIVPEIEYLHAATLAEGRYAIRPLWSTKRDPRAFAFLGHSGVLLSRYDTTLVALHRPNYQKAGVLVEFDCVGAELRIHSELAITTGDSAAVLLPRPAALEWTSGTVAVPDGFVVPLQRFTGSDDPWKTEVFRYAHGDLLGSVILDGQWTFMDYHHGRGILMTTNEPIPHFIVVPMEVLEDAIEHGQ